MPQMLSMSDAKHYFFAARTPHSATHSTSFQSVAATHSTSFHSVPCNSSSNSNTGSCGGIPSSTISIARMGYSHVVSLLFRIILFRSISYRRGLPFPNQSSVYLTESLRFSRRLFSSSVCNACGCSFAQEPWFSTSHMQMGVRVVRGDLERGRPPFDMRTRK